MPTEDRDPNLAGLAEIDRVIHEPARLLVLCNLYVLESADFLFLIRRTCLTRGNLSAHMRKLETAGYVDVEKTFVERLPLTVYSITQTGRKALQRYRKQITDGLSVVT